MPRRTHPSRTVPIAALALAGVAAASVVALSRNVSPSATMLNLVQNGDTSHCGSFPASAAAQQGNPSGCWLCPPGATQWEPCSGKAEEGHNGWYIEPTEPIMEKRSIDAVIPQDRVERGAAGEEKLFQEGAASSIANERSGAPQLRAQCLAVRGLRSAAARRDARRVCRARTPS